MRNYTNTTTLCLEPGASTAFSLDSTGEAYATPEDLRDSLGDLSRLSFLNAVFSGAVETDAVSSATVTVELKTAGSVLATQEIVMGGDTMQTFRVPEVDLSLVKGHEKLFATVTVDSAGAGENATLKSKLVVSHPLVIAGC